VDRSGRVACTAGELAIRCLAAHGVELVFGIPGTHNLPLYAHLEGYGIRHVSPRHEQGAGFAADGYARAGGRPGVAIVTTGPGVLNIATAVAQAWSDSVPLLVLAPGMPLGHPQASTGYLHEVPSTVQAMRGAAGTGVRVESHAELATELASAFAAFESRRPRPAFIEIPLDLLEQPGEHDVLRAPRIGRPEPDPEAIATAAGLLEGASRPAIVAGGGAQDAAVHLAAIAERLGAPVLTTANGKGVLSEEHPLSLGARLHHPAARRFLEREADVVLAIGTELAESDLWGPPLRLRGELIRVDIDPRQAHGNHPAAVALIADARRALELLALRLGPAWSRGEAPQALRAELDAATAAEAGPWLPALKALQRGLGPDAILAGDSAMCCYYGALGAYRSPGPRSFLYPSGLGTLGYGLPAAIGAKLAAPERPVAALLGDGGVMFTLPELASAAALQLPLPVVVFENGGYGEIRREMQAAGIPPVGVDLPAVDLPAAANALGANGVRVDSPEALEAAVKAALHAPGPTLIAVPEEAP
jgi:acetolactate synthase-1/2/3 large subunit